MDFQKALAILRPQWDGGYWAKSSGELLWAHQFTVWNVATKIASYVPKSAIDDSEQELLELACLTHDIGKMRAKCQHNLHSGNGPGDHKLLREELESYFRELLGNKLPLTDGQIQAIWDIARTHHSVSDKDFEAQEFEDADMIRRLLITADWIASMDRPDFATLGRLQEFYDRRFKLTYFTFSRSPTPTSYLVVATILQEYRKYAWTPLVVFPTSAVLIGKRDVAFPSRSAVTGSIESDIISRSLALQPSVPRNYSGDTLTLLSAAYPQLFLQANKSVLIDELGTINRNTVFLKLVADLLKSTNQLTKKSREECSLLAIVVSANSSPAHKFAREKYEETYGNPAPAKVNKEMIDPLFDTARFAEVIPSTVKLTVDRNQLLTKSTPQELFNTLYEIADSGKRNEGIGLRETLADTVSLEEELDFRRIATERFERYKTYKLTSDASKGVCEICGSTVAFPLQRQALNFSESGQAFSQIKPDGTKNRAICPLCGYDNLVIRVGVRSGSSPIFARIENRNPNLVEHFPSWRSLVDRLSAGLRSPRKIARMQDVEGCESLPFPNWLHIPLTDDTKSDDEGESKDIVVQQNDRGTLFKIGFTTSSRGPRDLRGQYEPVYHVLNLLGFQVSLGTEEQDGLFGSPVLTNEVTYLRSLAVVLLANQVDKKSNRFVYASELIDRSPSLALAFAAGDGRDRFGMRPSMLETFLDYLVCADISVTSKKGKVGMKRLLEDAAFLAPSLVEDDSQATEDIVDIEGEEEAPTMKRKRRGGIWSFCEHSAGEKMTKHSVTKPISQAMNELMLGRGVEFAINKFLQNVSKRIKAENTNDLNTFIAGVRDIIERAEDMRQENVTDFLRYKNGLLSAVFMFTRYPDLKSVLVSK